jgi:hypothetical protein
MVIIIKDSMMCQNEIRKEMEDYIMIKFTILTLMMILGMSSVSLGKQYLCETDFSRKIINLSNDKSKWESSDTHFYKMFIVKTVGNEERIL